jgi:hypothetical protein
MMINARRKSAKTFAINVLAVSIYQATCENATNSHAYTVIYIRNCDENEDACCLHVAAAVHKL